YPELYRNNQGQAIPYSVSLRTLRDEIVGDGRTSLTLLGGAVGLILLLACANTMQARLAQGLSRQQEFAIRAAIGAGRRRLLRQLLIESGLLSCFAAILGWALAATILEVVLALLPANPLFAKLTLNWRAFLFMGAVLFVTTILFGLAPALVASRP